MTARSLAVVLLLSACAHTSKPATDTLAPLFAQADAQRAKQDAPDFYARAERAYQEARTAASDDARADQTTRARILLDAAVAEADRVALERATSAADARAEQAVLQRADLERERLDLERAIERELAAASAREEAVHAFQISATDEQARPGRSKEADATRDEASRFVRDRATLTLAAALALGFDPIRGDGIASAIAATEHAATPTARLASAQHVLGDAERALGEARKARGAPTPEETASLIALAKERGLAPEPLPRGIAFNLDAGFAAGSAVPNAAGKHMLEALATVASAHPHGPIQIEALAAAAAPPAVQRAATTRAEHIKAALAAATDATRLVVVPTDAGSTPHARVVFAAYGMGTEGMASP